MKALAKVLIDVLSRFRGESKCREPMAQQEGTVVDLGSANGLVRGAPNGPARDSQGGFKFR